jgi:hypothetical protein
MYSAQYFTVTEWKILCIIDIAPFHFIILSFKAEWQLHEPEYFLEQCQKIGVCNGDGLCSLMYGLNS